MTKSLFLSLYFLALETGFLKLHIAKVEKEMCIYVLAGVVS